MRKIKPVSRGQTTESHFTSNFSLALNNTSRTQRTTYDFYTLFQGLESLKRQSLQMNRVMIDVVVQQESNGPTATPVYITPVLVLRKQSTTFSASGVDSVEDSLVTAYSGDVSIWKVLRPIKCTNYGTYFQGKGSFNVSKLFKKLSEEYNTKEAGRTNQDYELDIVWHKSQYSDIINTVKIHGVTHGSYTMLENNPFYFN